MELCAFSPNMGMGTNNEIAIEPPSILTDNVALFAFYNRIYVDGQSYPHMSGQYETKFFDALIAADFVEVVDRLYDKNDIMRCQAIFAAVFNSDFSVDFDGKAVDFADEEPRKFERRLFRIDSRVAAMYYVQLRNYCALKASATLRCPIVGLNKIDLAIQREILAHSTVSETVHDAVLVDPFARSFEALKAALDVEMEDFPLSVNVRGERAEPMSAVNQEVAPERWPEWYAERRIDPIESGRRLDAFLKFRRTPHLKAAQSYLRRVGTGMELPQHWFDAFNRSFAG